VTDHFTHLTVDSSALIGSGWPFPAVDLDNVVLGCRKAGIPLLISELALAEVEAVWTRQTADAIQAARRAMSLANRKLPGLIDAESVCWPNETAQRNSYAVALEKLRARWDWRIAPIPQVSLNDAVMRSVRHELPFAETDRAFRDSLILWSLLDQLTPGDHLGMIAADKVFPAQRMIDAASVRQIDLTVFQTPQAAWTVVNDMLHAEETEEFLAELDQERDRLEAALRADRERLDRFVRENLVIPERALGIDGRISEFHQIRLGEIISVQPPFAVDGTQRGSADVALRAGVTINRYTLAPVRVMRIGQSVTDVSPVLGQGETTLTEVDAFATVTFRIDWSPEEKEPPNIEYESAEFSTAEQQQLNRQTLLDLMDGGTS
jgi:hypothetical protein